uniref:Uncharacterized protein n=1 Tax=Anguilla anguilla TaxID=7936 RepID=A0A0E9T0C1_ANGAN
MCMCSSVLLFVCTCIPPACSWKLEFLN